MNDDVVGAALLDYYTDNYSTDIIVKSSISEDDIISIPYLFRSYKELPKIEKKALEICHGHVLDVGAGSGCHSIILQEKKLKVTAIDTSSGAVEVMKKRGLVAHNTDFFKIEGKFDTVLLLMNGAGIAGTLEGLENFLNQAISLLNKGGQIILDSSDIQYIYLNDDGSEWIDITKDYYGEVVYEMEYKKLKTTPFNWLFIDFEKLSETAKSLGIQIEKIIDGDHHDYLVRLWL